MTPALEPIVEKPQISVLRRIIKRVLPQRMRNGIRRLTDPARREAAHRTRHRARVQRLVAQCADQLWAATGGSVASGPFKGLHYTRESVGSAWAPKLLGTYEMELAPLIEAVVARRPAHIVDIGAAEGYYAVGLAWRLPHTRVTAFETHESGRQLLKGLAESNCVSDRIEVRGLCSPDALDASLQNVAPGALIFCDVEGAEMELLDPLTAPGLLKSDLLIEVHPWAHDRLEEVLRQRFHNTHSIQEIHTRPRNAGDLPAFVNPVPFRYAAVCLDETRPWPMKWLWMARRAGGGQ